MLDRSIRAAVLGVNMDRRALAGLLLQQQTLYVHLLRTSSGLDILSFHPPDAKCEACRWWRR